MIWISDHDGQKSDELSYFPCGPKNLTFESWYPDVSSIHQFFDKKKTWYVPVFSSVLLALVSPSVGHGTVPPQKKKFSSAKKMAKPKMFRSVT